jgi:hypothetical protein
MFAFTHNDISKYFVYFTNNAEIVKESLYLLRNEIKWKIVSISIWNWANNDIIFITSENIFLDD